MCAAKLPDGFRVALENADSEEAEFDAGVAHCIAQTEDLIANDVEGLHFYVLNKSAATKRILDQIDFSRDIVSS